MLELPSVKEALDAFELPTAEEALDAIKPASEGEMDELFICPPPVQRIDGDTARETTAAKNPPADPDATIPGE